MKRLTNTSNQHEDKPQAYSAANQERIPNTINNLPDVEDQEAGIAMTDRNRKPVIYRHTSESLCPGKEESPPYGIQRAEKEPDGDDQVEQLE